MPVSTATRRAQTHFAEEPELTPTDNMSATHATALVPDPPSAKPLVRESPSIRSFTSRNKLMV